MSTADFNKSTIHAKGVFFQWTYVKTNHFKDEF